MALGSWTVELGLADEKFLGLSSLNKWLVGDHMYLIFQELIGDLWWEDLNFQFHQTHLKRSRRNTFYKRKSNAGTQGVSSSFRAKSYFKEQVEVSYTPNTSHSTLLWLPRQGFKIMRGNIPMTVSGFNWANHFNRKVFHNDDSSRDTCYKLFHSRCARLKIIR